MNNIPMFELVMLSGCSPLNNLSYGFYSTRSQAELVAKFLLDEDAKAMSEWTGYSINGRKDIDSLARDAERWRKLKRDAYYGHGSILRKIGRLDTPSWDAAVDEALEPYPTATPSGRNGKLA